MMGWGRDWELFNGYRVSFLQDKKSSRGHLHNNENAYNTTEHDWTVYVEMVKMISFVSYVFYPN